MDFNATTHGQRDIDDDRLSDLIERISQKRLGLNDVEADIIGRSYEYLLRKFAEGGAQSGGEQFTPPEVGRIMALILDPEPGMSVYDPCCGSAGLLIACEQIMDEKMKLRSTRPADHVRGTTTAEREDRDRHSRSRRANHVGLGSNQVPVRGPSPRDG